MNTSCMFLTKADEKGSFALRPEDHLRPQDIFTDIQVLQRHLMDTLKLGSASAHACAELFTSCLIDSVVVFEALTTKELNTILAKDPSIPSAAKEVLVKHFEIKTSTSSKDAKVDDKSAVKTEVENDIAVLQKYLVETIGLGKSSAQQCAKVLTDNKVDSVAVLTNSSKASLETILVEPNVPKFSKDAMLLKLFPDNKSSTTASTTTAAATTTIVVEVNKEDVAALKTYLINQVKLSADGAQKCAELFAKAHIDSEKILLCLTTNEVNMILTPDIPAATRSLVLDSLEKAPRATSQMSDDQKQKLIAKAMEEAQKIMDEVSKANEKQSKENKANLDSLMNGMNTTAGKVDTKAETAPKETIVKEVDQSKKTEATKPLTVGNYGKAYKMAHYMSDGALRKGVNFINGPGFASRAACPLFDFIATASKFTDVDIMSNPKIEYKDIICYSSDAQSGFETAQQSGMTANSYSVKIAGFYGGFAGAVTANGSLATSSKSESSSISKTTGYSSYKTTSTIVKMNSFQLNLSKVCLDATAMQTFINVGNEAAAARFLANYGSHVLLTPHSTGGIFNSTANVTFQSEVRETDHSKALAQSKTFREAAAVVSLIGGASAAEEHKESDTDASTQKQLDEKTSYSLTYTVKTIGPQVLQFAPFYEALAASDMTHCLVSNGLNISDPATWAVKPVWEVMLDAAEWKDADQATKTTIQTAAKYLRSAWLSAVFQKTGGKLLESFMANLVSHALNYPLPGVETLTPQFGKETYKKDFPSKLLAAECDPFYVPINVWCYIANDLGTILEVPYGSTSTGTQPWMQAKPPDESISKKYHYWKFTPDGYIEAFNGLVLELPDSKIGWIVQLGAKANTTNQKFFFNKDRQLVTHVNTECCLDICNGTSGGGERILTWQRHGNSNQKWRFYPVYRPIENLKYVGWANMWCAFYVKVNGVEKYLEASTLPAGSEISGEFATVFLATEKRPVVDLTKPNGQLWKLTLDGYLESHLKAADGSDLCLTIKDDKLISPNLCLYYKVLANGQKWFCNNNFYLFSDLDRIKPLSVDTNGGISFVPSNTKDVTQLWTLTRHG